MRNLIVLLTSLVWLAPSSGFGADRTISCANPPDKAARLAVRDTAAVSKTQDKTNGTCTFAVDGAKAASPSAELIRQGFNSLRDGAPLVKELAAKQVDHLAYAMLATAPVSEIPSEFRNLLMESSSQLSTCLSDFFDGRDPSVPLGARRGGPPDGRNGAPQGTPVRCRMYRPTGVVEPADVSPYLEVVVTWSEGRFVSSLYVPRQYARLPKF